MYQELYIFISFISSISELFIEHLFVYISVIPESFERKNTPADDG